MLALAQHVQGAVFDKYRIIRELTRGGMSRVFLARDIKLERDVAIKVLSPDLVDPAAIERFRLEVAGAARLQHPTIIPLIEVGSVTMPNGRPVPFYVMPYAPGESVRSRLSHEGPFTIPATVRLLRDIFGALEHAHGFGLVHRDIKPENIYLSGSHAVLADFGIAKAVDQQRDDNLTNPGETVGTPAYMASEQLAGDPNTDHRADIYSVGVVSYELLAGRLPWRGKSPSERLAAQVKGEMQPLTELRDDIPEQLVATIERCLAYKAEERLQSATDALKMLESVALRPSTASFVVTERVTPVPWAVQSWIKFRPYAIRAATALLFTAWLFANIAYAGMRAQNTDSPGRIVAFVAGIPGTFVSRLVVAEGSERAYGIALPRR